MAWSVGACCWVVTALAALCATSTLASDVVGTKAAIAQTPPSLAEIRKIAAAGAVDLALDRLERDQPPRPDAPTWAQWEGLRLELLARKGRDAELLTRVRTHSQPGLSEGVGPAVLALAAGAALRVGEFGEARRFLARLFLSADVNGRQYRAARLSVIEVYLAEANVDAAYRSMLRFQQDFAPLQADEAERFVAGLVAAERWGDAAGWLKRLDPASPWSAMLRMRAGLLSPEAAIAQARAAIGKGAGDSAWTLLAAAGQAQGSRAIAVEVGEHRLNAAPLQLARVGRPEASEHLWQVYMDAAQYAANQAHLLKGDDAAWMKQSVSMLAAQPHLARSLMGYLVRSASSSQLRLEAQLGMIVSLRDAKMGNAALHLFSGSPRFSPDSLEPRLRLALGDAALEAGHPQLAVDYWRGLALPSTADMRQWQVRLCSALAQAGKDEEALAVARELLEARPVLPPQLLREMFDVAVRALGRFQTRTAEAMLTMLLPLASDADRNAVLAALASSYEANADYRAAAGAYLRAAVSATRPEEDREALRAREGAARNLLKSGLRDDAVAVYEWLARSAKDAAVREAAERALKEMR